MPNSPSAKHKRMCSDGSDVTRLSLPTNHFQESSSVRTKVASSPATQTLDLLEAQMSQDSCLLYVAPSDKSKHYSNSGEYPIFRGKCEVIDVVFQFAELGIELVEVTIVIENLKVSSKKVICENAAVVKQIFDNAANLNLKPGDIFCSNDYKNQRVLSYTDFVGMARTSSRPLRATVRRYSEFPVDDILGDNQAITNVAEAKRIESQTKPEDNDKKRHHSGLSLREISKIENGMKQNSKFGVTCRACSINWQQMTIACKDHNELCPISRDFSSHLRSICHKAAASGCGACQKILDQDALSTGANCPHALSCPLNNHSKTPLGFQLRNESMKENEKHGILCKLCSKGTTNGAHHIFCRRSRKFDEIRRDLCVKSAKDGCGACKLIILEGNKSEERRKHTDRCSLRKFFDDARKHSLHQNQMYGVKCQVCISENAGEAFDMSDISHHTLCTRNPKFDSGARETCFHGRKLGCPACEDILKQNTTNNFHSQACPRNISLTQISDCSTDSPPISEYEELRAKNIERNNERLLKLGLLNEVKSKQLNGVVKAKARDNPSIKKQQYSKDTSAKSEKIQRPKDGLDIGCEACLQKLRSNKVRSKHHLQCPLSRSRNNLHKVSMTSLCKEAPKQKPMNESLSANDSRRSIGQKTQITMFSPLQNAIYENEPVMRQLRGDDHKSRWERCGDPWGDCSHADGDFVLLVTDQDESKDESNIDLRVSEYGISSARFIPEPLSRIPYSETHRVGSDIKYNVLLLRRDPMATRSWGFNACRHEFGGACIVKSVNSCSPAEAAKDVGGFSSKSSSSTSFTVPAGSCKSNGLRVNDIIICINGKNVGGMSVCEAAVEFEVSGAELIIVVARCNDDKHQWNALTKASEEERMLWYNVDNGFDWQDLGKEDTKEVRASSSIKKDMYSDKEDSRAMKTFSSMKNDKHFDYTVVTPVVHNESLDKAIKKNKIDLLPDVNNKRPIVGCITKSRENSSSDSYCRLKSCHSLQPNKCILAERKPVDYDPRLDEIEDTDEKLLPWLKEDVPWNGCVCGETHPHPVEVFWIACDKCNAWYNVSPKCVGFEEDTAALMHEWVCRDCRPTELSPKTNAESNFCTTSNKNTFINTTEIYSTPNKDFLPNGTIVEVAKRTWSGINKPGGIGKVIGSTLSKNKSGLSLMYYDVRYVLGGYEKNIEAKYVSKQGNIIIDESPADSVRRRKLITSTK